MATPDLLRPPFSEKGGSKSLWDTPSTRKRVLPDSPGQPFFAKWVTPRLPSTPLFPEKGGSKSLRDTPSTRKRVLPDSPGHPFFAKWVTPRLPSTPLFPEKGGSKSLQDTPSTRKRVLPDSLGHPFFPEKGCPKEFLSGHFRALTNRRGASLDACGNHWSRGYRSECHGTRGPLFCPSEANYLDV